jgi:glycosyltransferase involved in cell wall biosynthesis
MGRPVRRLGSGDAKSFVPAASRGKASGLHRPDCARQEGSGVRALHIIAGLDPSHGGPSYTVPRLCEALSAAGAVTTLLSVAGADGCESDESERGYRDCRFRWDYAGTPILRHLRRSSALSRALREISAGADVIHDHGLWLLPNVEAGRAARRAGKPLIFSPRGMLAPAALAFSRVKKRAFWALLQSPAIRGAACIHATSEGEYQEVRLFGLAQPVAIIRNGIDIPERSAEEPLARTSRRVLLSLGRMHPKKGLDSLLRAWAKVETHYPDWWLRVVGPAEAGHDEELRALAITLGLVRVSIEGPIYGDTKTIAYRDADLFVLPTLNENFALTVAEALAAGTPAISTKGAPWSGLKSEGCGWWIDHGVEPLAAALAHSMTLPFQTLKAMGDKGREWMARDFSWDRVAHDMLGVYLWLARSAEPPPAIRFD